MRFAISKRAVLWVCLMAVLVASLIIGAIFTIKNRAWERTPRIHTGSIVANGKECANIGAQFMNDGGSVVDVIIATLICDGVMASQSMGLGGGFVGIIYTKSSNKIETIIARESAPAAAHKNMFVNSTKVVGAVATAVPGEILGYWEMHQKYGKLPWSSLFTPTIKMCREGVYVSAHMQKALLESEEKIRNEASMAEVFIKKDGTIYKEGEYLKRPQLANTLETLALAGADAFYKGALGKTFVEDVQKLGGIITEEDLRNYRTRWSDKNHVQAQILDDLKLYTTPLPSSGVVLSFIFQVIKDIFSSDRLVNMQRTIETFKHAYGQRTKLGDADFDPEMKANIRATQNNLFDEKFINEIRAKIFDNSTSEDYKYYGAEFSGANDHGTANVAVLGNDGSAVVITSTVNNYFGCKRRSSRTGIILNDEMDDFSTPGLINGFGLSPSPANFIYPNKIPLSSMCPSIILDNNGDVKMLIGAAGGSKITTSVAQAIIRYLVLNYNMSSAINDPRLHHQLSPMYVEAEPNVDPVILEHLKAIGHVVNVNDENAGFAAINGIGVQDKYPTPVFDKRRLGSLATVPAKNKMQH